VSSPSGVRGTGGRAPAGNAFWHILKATDFLYLYADALSNRVLQIMKNYKIWGRREFALASLPSKFWGLVPNPRVIYAHASFYAPSCRILTVVFLLVFTSVIYKHTPLSRILRRIGPEITWQINFEMLLYFVTTNTPHKLWLLYYAQNFTATCNTFVVVLC